ncbi:MAG TPA: arsenate reductase ArsC [Candidatus Xenobia bacterium]
MIFACVHSAGRSQMAAAFYSQLVGAGLGMAAGTEPADRVHPEVVATMHDLGIDVSIASPQLLTVELARTADRLVTMGCGEKCPWVPGLPVEEWSIPDPKGQPAERVAEIRDTIHDQVRSLVARLAAR